MGFTPAKMIIYEAHQHLEIQNIHKGCPSKSACGPKIVVVDYSTKYVADPVQSTLIHHKELTVISHARQANTLFSLYHSVSSACSNHIEHIKDSFKDSTSGDLMEVNAQQLT